MGGHDLEDPKDGVIIGVDCLNIVPTRTPEQSPFRDGDLALLIVVTPIDLSKNSKARAACLPSSEDYHNVPVNIPTLYISGWGSAPEIEAELSPRLRSAVLPYITPQECEKRIGSLGFTYNMICAGGQGKDICFGDSGGNLQLTDR